jgi:very-short-patch-repair endonuclease
MAYKDSDNQIVVVKYDGDHHYRNSLQIKRDFEKDELVKGLGFKVIRIPYWVQLTVQTQLLFWYIS